MGQRPADLDPSLSSAAYFGAQLRQLRTQRGLSLSKLGQLVHTGGDLLGKIEKAQRRATPELIEALDAELGADGSLILAAPATRLSKGTSPPLDFLKLMPGGRVAMDPAIAGLREMLRGLRQVDHALGSGPALAIVRAQLHVADAILLAASNEAERRSALAVVAELHQLAGWMHFDRGELAPAESALTRARSMAEEAGQADLAAYVLGPSHGFMTANHGHLPVGRELCAQALAQAQRSGNRRLTAFVVTIAARIEAKLGEEKACRMMLDLAAAELELARSGASSSPDPDWLSVFDEAALAGHAGSCLLDLGSHGAAITALTQQDETASDLFVRNRVIWQLDRSDAHLAQGEVAPACDDLYAAWQAAAGTTSARLTHRLAISLNNLTPWQSTAEVKELRARVLAGAG
ncbi:helix-turn-helix domain-containing protein [Kineosporia babensis]|uniref:Helix-turn-helix domain-containing protein n=1 Tax=Kineosporia babensis TaxID=499548 RepID=A0A9X1NME8_9ACTN|nr:helix-turn-helix transcriptional regulator [Kineosporia babensis]MCD5316823.1 helix-turn-helix domain-containing protein [Kineosporia babensis]